jgi:hypothetical protein
MAWRCDRANAIRGTIETSRGCCTSAAGFDGDSVGIVRVMEEHTKYSAFLPNQTRRERSFAPLAVCWLSLSHNQTPLCDTLSPKR